MKSKNSPVVQEAKYPKYFIVSDGRTFIISRDRDLKTVARSDEYATPAAAKRAGRALAKDLGLVYDLWGEE